MVRLISSLVWLNLNKLLNIFRTEPTAQRTLLVRAVVDTHCTLIRLTPIIDTDEAILSASEEPATIYDCPRSKLALGRHPDFVN